MYQDDLLKTLCINAEKEMLHVHQCGKSACLTRLQQQVKLYMTIRIHHAIKISNIGMSSGHKRNRKMLKLCHE